VKIGVLTPLVAVSTYGPEWTHLVHVFNRESFQQICSCCNVAAVGSSELPFSVFRR
jgi:hypothetical protein